MNFRVQLSDWLFFFRFEVGWQLEFVRYFYWGCCNILGNWIHSTTLWAGRDNDQSIREVRRRACPIQLVFVTGWTATNVHDFRIEYTKSVENLQLRRHYVRTRNIQKGTWIGRTFLNWKIKWKKNQFSDYQQCIFILYDDSQFKNLNVAVDKKTASSGSWWGTIIIVW